MSGQLMHRGVDARYLVLFGLPITIASMVLLGHLTAQSGYDDAQFGLMVRGFGLGFVSTPITVASFAGLSNRQLAPGAALLNLCRQLGGSFGIAILGSYVESSAAAHRTTLVSHLSSSNQLLTARVAETAVGLVEKGMNPAAAHAAALGLVDRAVQAQSMTMAYDDAYLLVGAVLAVLIPTVFLFKRRRFA
jgi:DHA2 family multidrug resistance protein